MELVRNAEPRMLKHARTNRAFIVVRERDGRRRQIALGEWDTPEASRRYHQELARWHARQRGGEAEVALLEVERNANLTIAGAAARFALHTEAHYRLPDGTPTGEADNLARAIAPLLELFADEPLADMTPRMLKLVRQRMVEGDPTLPAEERRGWCRTYANASVKQIRRFVKWCVAEGFVSPVVHAGLCALAPLKEGRTNARESKLPQAVPDDVVRMTLPFLPSQVLRDMVLLHRLIGCRSGELCRMVSSEIDRSESVREGSWVFRPTRAKQHSRGRVAAYPLNALAIAIVKRYLRADPRQALFSPAQSEQQRHELMREHRETKVQPSQVDRRVNDPKRPPSDQYGPRSYGHAVRDAARRAGAPHWSPHDLRRAAATEAAVSDGIDGARALLGHKHVDVTKLYAARDLRMAADVSQRIKGVCP